MGGQREEEIAGGRAERERKRLIGQKCVTVMTEIRGFLKLANQTYDLDLYVDNS